MLNIILVILGLKILVNLINLLFLILLFNHFIIIILFSKEERLICSNLLSYLAPPHILSTLWGKQWIFCDLYPTLPSPLILSPGKVDNIQR